jgi:hypothetical protein
MEDFNVNHWILETDHCLVLARVPQARVQMPSDYFPDSMINLLSMGVVPVHMRWIRIQGPSL